MTNSRTDRTVDRVIHYDVPSLNDTRFPYDIQEIAHDMRHKVYRDAHNDCCTLRTDQASRIDLLRNAMYEHIQRVAHIMLYEKIARYNLPRGDCDYIDSSDNVCKRLKMPVHD